jgi:hypothetical protein
MYKNIHWNIVFIKRVFLLGLYNLSYCGLKRLECLDNYYVQYLSYIHNDTIDVSIRWRKYIKFHILDLEKRQTMNHDCITLLFIIFQLFHDKHYHINVSSMCTKLDIYVFIVMFFIRKCIKKEANCIRNKQVFDLSKLH